MGKYISEDLGEINKTAEFKCLQCEHLTVKLYLL